MHKSPLPLSFIIVDVANLRPQAVALLRELGARIVLRVVVEHRELGIAQSTQDVLELDPAMDRAARVGRVLLVVRKAQQRRLLLVVCKERRGERED